MSALGKRIKRLEESAGVGPCPMCEAREARPDPPLRPDLRVVERLARYEMNCPRCGRPFELVVEYVARRAA